MRREDIRKSCVGPQERLDFDKKSPWWSEHVSRYYWAVENIKGSIILDAACGNGFGSDILHKDKSRKILGIDISEQAIKTSVQNFAKDNISFLRADAEEFPFSDDSIDSIVSFETIEHLKNNKKYLKECKRVLRNKGIFICSTPNAILSKDENSVNPFHIKEFTTKEFNKLLLGYFSEVKLFGQMNERELGYSPFKKMVWKILLLRGIRKLPYSMRNYLSNIFTGKTLYPRAEEFQFLTSGIEKAPTISSICRK